MPKGELCRRYAESDSHSGEEYLVRIPKVNGLSLEWTVKLQNIPKECYLC